MTIDDTARVAAPEQPAAALAVPESAPPGPLSARVRGGWILEAVALLGAAVLHELLRNAEMGKAAVGNLYGGMPSHHVSWSLLCVVAIWPVVKRRWVKGLVLLHPLLTIGAITVTGQHHFIDIAGSCIEVALALLVGIALERALGRRRARRQRRKLERELAVGTPPNT